MKRMVSAGMMAALTAGAASAQSGMFMVGEAANDLSQTKVTVEAAVLSSYVWRGQVRNNDFVFQPQITASQYGVSLNVWGNFDMGKNLQGVQSDFSEIDLSLAYTLPLDINDVAFDVGLVAYNYPANGDGGTGYPTTMELFARATVLSFKDYVIPSVTFFGDVDEADGPYILFDVAVPYQVSDYLSVEGGISAGWGNTSYNDYYFPNGTVDAEDPRVGSSQDEGWNDYNFYANASYEVMEGLTVSVNATYTMLEGGSIAEAAKDIYESKDKFWGGVSVAYDF